ncbi:nicotinamide riboside transporter PnuC [Candidatus Sulfidibacterium hydrothermale]|uniref:nicotinamide riboside transporter PnuC n=1 Tax=Candidatus Sulfidibacterium hydrothermale TaxID=2875962 RepID=UPI001F0B3A7F|nr:nicotinamide riboside transporter PnuC [Candidatus Sulfidibacterium hydrothermale]UBM63109.1 nicotinamide riboside transporter PnuC [Candidatus Sulfidibacterium hydrothermale]
MDIHYYLQLLYQNIMDSSWLEIVAAALGILSVWYARKANILVYPTGIVSVLIYVYICYNAQLYADMGINAYYFVFSVYGWIMWSKKDENKEELPVTYSDKKTWMISIGVFLLSLVVIQILLRIFKAGDTVYWSSFVPYTDTFTTAVAIVGMWLMAVKKVENWLFWIAADVVSVPLYLYKGLVFTSLQYFVFLVLAVLGYFEWRRLAKENLEIHA